MTVVGKLIWMAVTTALSYAAAYLLRPKQPKTPLDDNRTEPSARGTLLGVMNGHYRIGPVIGTVGNRYTKDEKLSGGGKGGGSDPTQTVYYESGWHLLNNGEGRTLRRIYQAGKPIWQGEISPTSHPSGTSVDLGTEGRFYVYWGEIDQPVNTGLSELIGVNSRWPKTFYIWWETKRLGTSAVWPSLEYEITCAPYDTGKITDDNFFVLDQGGYQNIAFEVYTKIVYHRNGRRTYHYWDRLRIPDPTAVPDLIEGMDINIEDTLGNVIFRAEITSIDRDATHTYIYFNNSLPLTAFDSTVTSSGWYSSTELLNSDAFTNQGANPAASLDQFLFRKTPFGAGFDPTLFDNSLQDISTLMVSEEMSCTSLMRSGRSWQDGMASIMQDMGLLMVMDPATGLYGFKALRDDPSVTSISEDYYSKSSMEISYAYSVLASDSRVFTYKDSARNFADSTLPAHRDSKAIHGADPNVKSVALETITSYIPASKVVARRDSEESVNGSTGVDINYLLNPVVGEAVTLDGFDTVYRVLTVETNPDEAFRAVGLIEDAYISGGDFTEIPPIGVSALNRKGVSPDTIVLTAEVNRFLNPNTHGYHVFRIRYDRLATGGYVYHSPDNLSYSLNGEAQSVTGGFLTESLPDTTGVFVEVGPEFEFLGEDIDKVRDLSSSTEEWTAGNQMCLIGGELFFLRSITAVGGDTYRLDGLLRARYGTGLGDHSPNDVLVIFTPSDLDIFYDTWVLPGQDIYTKVLPFNSNSSTAIEDIIAVDISPYQGGGYRPLPPENLNTLNEASAWISGDDVELRWDYKNASSLTGAGFSLSDEPSEVALPEGYFRVEILNGTTVVRTEEVLVNTFTYTQANMITDFGSEPTTFNVQVVEILNGLTSDADSATIDRV